MTHIKCIKPRTPKKCKNHGGSYNKPAALSATIQEIERISFIIYFIMCSWAKMQSDQMSVQAAVESGSGFSGPEVCVELIPPL